MAAGRTSTALDACTQTIATTFATPPLLSHAAPYNHVSARFRHQLPHHAHMPLFCAATTPCCTDAHTHAPCTACNPHDRSLRDFGIGRHSIAEGGLGLFILGGGAVAVALIAWVRGNALRSGRPYTATFEFPTACGITVGTPVRIRGVQVGGSRGQGLLLGGGGGGFSCSECWRGCVPGGCGSRPVPVRFRCLRAALPSSSIIHSHSLEAPQPTHSTPL